MFSQWLDRPFPLSLSRRHALGRGTRVHRCVAGDPRSAPALPGRRIGHCCGVLLGTAHGTRSRWRSWIRRTSVGAAPRSRRRRGCRRGVRIRNRAGEQVGEPVRVDAELGRWVQVGRCKLHGIRHSAHERSSGWWPLSAISKAILGEKTSQWLSTLKCWATN